MKSRTGKRLEVSPRDLTFHNPGNGRSGMMFMLRGIGAAATALAVLVLAVIETAAAVRQAVHYTLLGESYLIDDCPPCGRPTILEPLRGGFDLLLVEENPILQRFEIQNITFSVGTGKEARYRITGAGMYERRSVGPAEFQEMRLEVDVDTGPMKELLVFTNESKGITRLWPMMDIQVDETPGFFTRVYRLRLVAAPLREIWFATASGLTSAEGDPARIAAGDLLAHTGRVVKSNQELVKRLGIQPVVPDLPIDALDLLPGGEIIFSLVADEFSEQLGPLADGDLISNRGRILEKNARLLSAFGISDSKDAGLDAVEILETGEILFSIKRAVQTSAGLKLGSGDLLSNEGRVVKTEAELLMRFHPNKTEGEAGLDALCIWPSGEIWFSTQLGFQDNELGPVWPGDLLSDHGYIVFRNLELVGPFQPIEDLADFGLAGLFIVSDLVPPAAGPRFHSVAASNGRDLILGWEGSGRAFQLEKAEQPGGPYRPISPIIPDLEWSEHGGISTDPQAFFRLRQW